MGYYVNPGNESKESFLNREGILAPSNFKISWASVPKGFVPVVLIDNRRFTAAVIAYSECELESATDMDDERPRQIFLIKTEKLFPVTDSYFAEEARELGLV